MNRFLRTLTSLCAHDWGWPRMRVISGEPQNVQVCTQCGQERVSVVQFAQPKGVSAHAG